MVPGAVQFLMSASGRRARLTSDGGETSAIDQGIPTRTPDITTLFRYLLVYDARGSRFVGTR